MIQLKNIWPLKLFYRERPKNWPHQIIDFLYQHYTEAETELNRFLYEKLHLSDTNTTQKDKIKELLNNLQEKGYLKWKANKVEINEQGGEQVVADMTYDFHAKPNLGLKDARLEARLTLTGLDYAIELKRERQKHRTYMISTPASLAFALLAFLVSLLTFIRSCNQEDKEAPKVEIRLHQDQQKTIPETTKMQDASRLYQEGHSTILQDYAKSGGTQRKTNK